MAMVVQKVVPSGGGAVSWTVVDEAFEPVEPIEAYLAHLEAIERSPKAKSSCVRQGSGRSPDIVGGVSQAAVGGVRMVVPSSLVVTVQPRDRNSASLRRARCSGDWRRS
jgi:hypothetical protein